MLSSTQKLTFQFQSTAKPWELSIARKYSGKNAPHKAPMWEGDTRTGNWIPWRYFITFSMDLPSGFWLRMRLQPPSSFLWAKKKLLHSKWIFPFFSILCYSFFNTTFTFRLAMQLKYTMNDGPAIIDLSRGSLFSQISTFFCFFF